MANSPTNSEPYLTDAELADVGALVEMMRQFFEPVQTKEVPEEVLEDLARDLIAHYGDETPAAGIIERHLGPYMP